MIPMFGDLLIVVSVIVFTFVIGYLFLGTSPKLFRVPGLGVETLSLLYGFSLVSFVSIWKIYLNAPSLLSLLVTLVLVIFFTSGMYKSLSMIPKWSGATFRVKTDTFVAILISVASISPQISNAGRLSLGIRLGPDALGYGIASQAIGTGNSTSNVIETVESQLPYGDVVTALSARVQSLYLIPSWTDQINAEFLIGAKRWGVIGHQSVFVEIFGMYSVWKIQAALSGLAIALTLFIVRDLSRSYEIPIAISCLSMIAIGSSPLLLNALHEGGVAQIYTLPFMAAFAFLLIKKESIPKSQEILLYCLIFVSLMASYNDALVLVVGTFLLFVSVRIVQGDNEDALNQLERFWTGFLLSMVAALPVLAIFARIFTSRAEDGGQAGWDQPRWLSAFDILGFSNAFGNPTAQAFNSYLVRPELSLFITLIFIGIVFRQGFNSKYLALFISYLAVIMGVYLKTRYIDGASNYQFTKAATTMSPLLWSSLVVAISARTQYMQRKKLVNVYIAGLVIFSVLASASWHSGWRNTLNDQSLTTSWVIDKGFSSTQKDELDKVFNSYDFIQINNSRSVAAASLSNFHFINRGINNKPILSSKPNRKVGFLVDEFNCPGLKCVASVPDKEFAFKSEFVAVVHLGDDSGIFDGLPAYAACEHAKKVFWIKWDIKMENCGFL